MILGRAACVPSPPHFSEDIREGGRRGVRAADARMSGLHSSDSRSEKSRGDTNTISPGPGAPAAAPLPGR